jgi:hypothetical protein
MKTWVINECNKVHIQWNVCAVDEKPLLQALDTMAGEKIPDWLPIRVCFEAEDGEIAMQLDYENRTGSYCQSINLNERESVALARKQANPFETGQAWQRENLTVQELPLRPAQKTPEWSATMRPADFIHSSGRNLCSTYGWWPESSTTSMVLLDSTHKASAFSCMRPQARPVTENSGWDIHGYPCLALSWWPQSPLTSVESSTSRSTLNAVSDRETTEIVDV